MPKFCSPWHLVWLRRFMLLKRRRRWEEGRKRRDARKRAQKEAANQQTTKFHLCLLSFSLSLCKQISQSLQKHLCTKSFAKKEAYSHKMSFFKFLLIVSPQPQTLCGCRVDKKNYKNEIEHNQKQMLEEAERELDKINMIFLKICTLYFYSQPHEIWAVNNKFQKNLN